MSFYIIPFFVMNPLATHGRSMYRRSIQQTPQLQVSYHEGADKRLWRIKSDRLEEHPLFHTFDKSFFNTHLLPNSTIINRNGQGTTEGSKLTELIEDLIIEIQEGKKKFTHFTIVGSKNFNKRHHYGLLILKFNDYPFIVKLFIETPASFVDPYTKGIESMCFFFMGGGVNRHLMGFTRVKNLETIKEKIAASPDWASRTDVPRKWFWLPKNASWLRLEGDNIAYPGHKVVTTIPAVYGIVADCIDSVRKFSLFNSEDKKIALDLSNFLEMLIDAHIDNFMIEKSTNKIVIVDTEYFPMLVGMKEGPGFKNYFQYFSQLTLKFLRDAYGHTKHERQALRTCTSTPISREKVFNFSESLVLTHEQATQTELPPCCLRLRKTT